VTGKKLRIDILLVDRGLAESRSQAQRLVMAGQVRANGQIVPKPASLVPGDAVLEILQGPRFVSRGGEKLEAALEGFQVQIGGLVCADVGASTGGFTDCLLQNGAARVYTIDVGHGILHWKLRQDARIVVMEDTNARYVERLPEPVALITIDASFISLKILLPVVKGWFGLSGGRVIALIKPQFEAGRSVTARGEGVIRDPKVHRMVLLDILEHAQQDKYAVVGLIQSPLLGPKGNVEFLVDLVFPSKDEIDVEGLISNIIVDSQKEDDQNQISGNLSRDRMNAS
jgi:23S rRNA (cytidine1920-2'-O)/16S rRNA (cytidine1409-2'-O)-methyltransferase